MGGPISKSIMGGPFMLVPKVVYGELMRLRWKEEDDVGWRRRTTETETMTSFWMLHVPLLKIVFTAYEGDFSTYLVISFLGHDGC
nr:hypothetical protein [Tanacetum cinerariifolium]